MHFKKSMFIFIILATKEQSILPMDDLRMGQGATTAASAFISLVTSLPQILGLLERTPFNQLIREETTQRELLKNHIDQERKQADLKLSLYHGIQTSNPRLIKQCIQDGASRSFNDQHQDHSLFLAIKKYHDLKITKRDTMDDTTRNHHIRLKSSAFQIIEILIQHNADPNIYIHDSNTPLLIWATNIGYYRLVKSLLQSKRIQINAQNINNETALIVGLKKAQNNSKDPYLCIVRKLLKRKASLEMTDDSHNSGASLYLLRRELRPFLQQLIDKNYPDLEQVPTPRSSNYDASADPFDNSVESVGRS